MMRAILEAHEPSADVPHHASQDELTGDLLKLILDTTPNLVFVKDENSVFLLASKALLALFPPDRRSRVIGYTMTEAFSPDEVETFLAEDHRAFRDGSTELIEDIVTYDGKKRIFHTKKVAFHTRDGEIRLLGLSRDITDLAIRERQLVEANQQLMDFATTVAHDLRSPLTNYITALEAVQTDPRTILSPAAERRLQNVIDSAENLSRMMSSVLKTAKISANGGHIDRPMCDLNLLVAQTRFNLGTQLENAGMRLYSDSLPMLAVDGELFRQLIQNLVENSIKYRRRDRTARVTLRYKRTGHAHRITVEDNGVGIPPNMAATMFKMFEGSEIGVGLALCQRIVKLHGGTISLDRYYTNGCRIWIDLPLDDHEG